MTCEHENGMNGTLMTNSAYSQPRVMKLEVAAFAVPTWGAPAEDDSFRNLRPFYLVYRKHSLTVSAVRFKFENERRYRDWQTVSVIPGDDTCSWETESDEFLLLGFVSPGVPFDAELRCCDAQGRIGIAEGHGLIALESRPFQFAHLSYSLDGRSSKFP